MASDAQDDNPWTRPPQAFVRPPPPRPAGPDADLAGGAAVADAPDEPLIGGPPARKAAVVAMLAAGAVAGVGIGWGLHRLSPALAPPPEVQVAVTAPPPAAPVMPVEVAAAPVAPTVAVTEAEAEPLATPPPAPPPEPAVRRTKVAKAHAAPVRVARAARRRARAPAGTPAAAVEPVAVAPPQALAELPAPRAGEPCGWAQSRAQRMLCEDHRLARADQRMRRAYERALAAGVPQAELASDQADWRRVREEAAQRSRGAVVRVYSQRIDELEAMARDR